MRKVILAVAVIAAIGFTSCEETKKEEKTTTENLDTASIEGKAVETFGVRGNCGMCKATIEKAANSVDGVAKSTWDVDHKIIKVAFDSTKTDVTSIKKAIAASGYDTEGFTGSEAAYEKLPACCHYDHEMKMNQ
ncbi:heavy-metal-associated domain-containing protein [Neptunitalea lumnitzerae]|uniref:HMA domain-containing protein n=1 Tax=Neptunitalea lumnitzerae TaxID=2965509 RepID=A0ABQ5MK58_9FLAO|nr:heavy-metal-associated domain-containing protein [Neptunitalea sp. Y10]GLB49302.1 hypothetical protein Y10_16700 [Neptunitalea sp. Y10]